MRTGLSSSSHVHWKSWHIALLTARGIVNIKCTDVFVLSFGKLLEIWSAGFLDTPFIQLSVSVSLRCMYHTSLCVCVLTMVSSSQFIDVLMYWQTTVSITVTVICLLQFVHVCWLTADNVDDFCFFFAGKCCHLGWAFSWPSAQNFDGVFVSIHWCASVLMDSCQYHCCSGMFITVGGVA